MRACPVTSRLRWIKVLRAKILMKNTIQNAKCAKRIDKADFPDGSQLFLIINVFFCNPGILRKFPYDVVLHQNRLRIQLDFLPRLDQGNENLQSFRMSRK